MFDVEPELKEREMPDRRAHPRRPIHVRSFVAGSPESRLPRARTVDVSPGGLLLAFVEPVGMPVTSRLVVSLVLPDGRFHALGTVRRVERGDDHRTYVAMSFDDLSADEFVRLTEQFDAVRDDLAFEGRLLAGEVLPPG